MRGAARILSAAALLAGCGGEGAYPSRPISIICPAAVGGGTDTVSRITAALLEASFGVPVSVINRPGGGMATGHAAGANARPDGYTATTITAEIAMMHWRGFTPLGPADIEPVIQLNEDAAALFVRTGATWARLEDLLAVIRDRPGELRASGTVVGGIWHLACAGAMLAADLPADALRWVPSEGAAPALRELAAGGVDVVVASLPEGRGLLDAGQVRSLGVMADERLAPFPDIPTWKEQGIDWSIGTWRGIALPRGTPRAIVERLEGAIAEVAGGDRFRTMMERSGFGIRVRRAEAFAGFIAENDATFGRLIRTSLATPAGGDGVPGPWFFPGIVAGLLAITAVVLLRGPRARHAALGPRGWLRVAEILGAVIIYAVAAGTAGFIVTGGGIAIYLFRRLGAGWIASAGVTLALVPGIYAFFAKLLRVPLPTGWIPW
ncbi:MAG: tripartite tricarboxylate transporter TctB family protein [Planctomycetes bacterium]|nr:tripartite tricarboxylate transporter TctB family protein [Planctomycetota bacterium]